MDLPRGEQSLAAPLGKYISQVCTRSWENSARRQNYLYSWPLPSTGIRRQQDRAELLKSECLEGTMGPGAVQEFCTESGNPDNISSEELISWGGWK